MTTLADMCRMSCATETFEVTAGSMEYFQHWVRQHGSMREMPADELPVPMFCGVIVRVNPLMKPDQVMITNDTDTRIFELN